jgi:protein TonB
MVMQNEGFLGTPRHNSKLGLGLVIAGHGAAITALMLAAPEAFERIRYIPTKTYDVPQDKVPPDARPQPRTNQSQAASATTQPIVKTSQAPDLVIPLDPFPPRGGDPINITPVQQPKLEPVFVEAVMDPTAQGRFQPDYPSSMARAGTEGFATVRVLIGSDGRVRQVVSINTTDPAFFAATERQALRAWRFKPASRDGVPTESWRTLTVRFKMVS